MIHILRGGFALCSKAHVPGDWGDGHRWVPLEEAEHATCRWCRYTASKGGHMPKAKSVPPPADHDLFPPVDVEPPPRKPLAKTKADAAPSTLRVAGCELQTAPEHVLVVRLTGETDELIGLRQAIQRALHPEDGGEAGLLPVELSSTLPPA